MYAHICKELMLPIRTIAGGSAARVINLLNNATVNDTVSLGTYHYYTVCLCVCVCDGGVCGGG